MKEALVSKGPSVQIVDSPIPTIAADQVLIKVAVGGINPKDWKLPQFQDLTINAGDDIAGVVEQVGSDVFEFKPGDRVAAFHEIKTAGGGYAQYAVANDYTTFHLAAATSFEEAAAIPLAAMTAIVAMYQHLDLPAPWMPKQANHAQTPLLIYGASSAVGFYALQLAQHSGIHPIIAIAGRATDYVRQFIDPTKGDIIIDYRESEQSIIAAISQALQDKLALYHALDAISEGPSTALVGRVFEHFGDKEVGRFTFTGMGAKPEIPAWVSQNLTFVGSVHANPDLRDFAYVWSRYLGRGLRDGWFRGQRTKVVPGGLDGIEGALYDLKGGRASAVKYVFRVDETSGLSS